MRLDEVWTLFERISHYYPNFTADDDKAEAWQRVLSDIPFDVACENLEEYVKESIYPPTIADIRRGGSEEKSNVPGVEETRQWLREVDRMRERAVPMPEHVRKELRRIVRGRA